jgi:hypothetical protein
MARSLCNLSVVLQTRAWQTEIRAFNIYQKDGRVYICVYIYLAHLGAYEMIIYLKIII